MPDGEVHVPHYPTVGFVLDAVAGWINKYRQAVSYTHLTLPTNREV